MKKLYCILSLCLCLIGCVTTSTNGSSNDPSADKKMVAVDANLQLGMQYLQDGNVEIAKQKLLLALQLAPDYPPCWYIMAYYLEVTGNTQKANDYYLHAIHLDPKSGDSQNNYGTFLCHSGKAKESIPYFLAATQDSAYIETSAAYENAGLCALKIPDMNLAKNYFNKAVTTDPNRDRSLVELATINYQQGHYALAKQQVKSVQLLHKSSPELMALEMQLQQK
jgi:type IV pilus assembly protein PilF